MPSKENGRTPRKVFGGMVRFHREKAGVSRNELAKRICKSLSLVQAIEQGDRAATDQVTADIDAALDLGGALVQLREEMADGLGYQAYPSWFQEWLSYEQEAKRLRWFAPLLVPGLLQTADYAKAVFRTRFGITDDEIEELVAARLKRQQILDREHPPKLWVIMDEAILHRAAGGAHVMREQLRQLWEMTHRPNVSFQIIPASVGVHEGLRAGGFAVADIDAAPIVGYQETASQGQFVDHDEHVKALCDSWDTLVREALPWKASQSLLEEVSESWTSTT